MKKQEKKFVLAALALLAITGLLALAGCKNDTVPEPTRYTVKFDKNAEDASGEMQSQIFTEGVEQELSANQFKRATYTFSGWSEDKAATAPTYKDKAKFKATKDTTLYAVWTDNGTVAPVNFSLPDGTKFYFGESIEVSLETTTEGATIQYHLGDGSWKDYTADTTISITGDTTITAKAAKEGLKPSTKTTATYTVRKLEGITVTSPERTVYSVGEEVVHKKDEEIEVTATYDEGEERAVTGTITTDTKTLTESAGIGKPVTVSYTEGDTTQTFTFTVDVASYKFTETVQNVDSSYAGTMTGGTYKKFGDWPQTIKEERVEIGAGTLVRGGLTYHVGSDGNYYVKITAKPYDDIYTYSDGNLVEKDKEVYFKVEPIVWRVLTEDYKAPDGKSTGNALLLAESILTGGVPYYAFSDTREITKEKETETETVTVYPNNWQYSTVRAWLNGRYESDDPQDTTYTNKGFLQTAFTADAQSLIADTSVDNSAASTNPASDPNQWVNGENPYASDTPTTNKVFLLSEAEATTGAHLEEKGITAEDYGFDEYSESGKGNTRIRVTTDYAKATGAYQGDPLAGYGGRWWLRSPSYSEANYARVIYYNGDAYSVGSVYSTLVGVVPALSISLGGN